MRVVPVSRSSRQITTSQSRRNTGARAVIPDQECGYPGGGDLTAPPTFHTIQTALIGGSIVGNVLVFPAARCHKYTLSARSGAHRALDPSAGRRQLDQLIRSHE